MNSTRHQLGPIRRWVMLIPVVLVTGALRLGASEQSVSIPEPALDRLRKELHNALQFESTIQQRRELKHLVRAALDLVQEHADAPNRYRALGYVFQAQKELLILRNDERNRQSLIETCRKLAEAPLSYATDRLPADVLLMQLELDSNGATEHERAVAIAELADRYRDTSGELDSLIAASELAFNLGERELLSALRSTLASKFRENPKAIGFLKDRFASKSTSLMFRGRFKRHDGETIVLPIDRAGHVYLSCFWSGELHDLKERLIPIRELQAKHPGRFEVFSFNLDELPDAGKSRLDALGLDWTPMHLPEGSRNPLFRACGSDPKFLIRITNAHGYIILTPIGSTYRTYGRNTDLDEYMKITLDKAPFLAMTQSIRIGDFLITGSQCPNREELPAETLETIKSLFVAAPMRYRLSMEDSLNNYAQADQLCTRVIKEHPDARGLWYIRNCRIIALLGQWNLSGEPEYFRRATEEAEDAFAAPSPDGAKLVPGFCLAKAAIREGEPDVSVVLNEFLDAAGGDRASGLAVAAATVLSLDGGSPVLFAKYHERLMNDHMDDPRLWPVTAYFFNKFVVRRLFRGNYYSTDVRVYAGFRSWQKNTEIRPRRFLMHLRDLKGKPIAFPHPDKDKSNIVVFMEPPADAPSAAVQADLMRSLNRLADAHALGHVNVTAAFVSDDAGTVSALTKKNGWQTDRVAMVPDGLNNPHVTRLGIFLAAERPNTFVVAPDGTILWSISGMYQMGTSVSGVTGTVQEMVQKHDLASGRLALEEGKFAKALRIFRDALPDYRGRPQAVKHAQQIGIGRALIGLERWQEALQVFGALAKEHDTEACRAPCACRSLARKLIARAEMLEKLGRDAEAGADRERAKHLNCPRDGAIGFHAERYEQETFDRLQSMCAREQWEDALAYIDEIIVHGRDGRQAERQELAELLHQYANILAQLNENPKAENMRQWALALTEGITAPETVSGENNKKDSYVDSVN